MIRKIVSGGQTGADQGALDAAIALGIPHGGWIAKGRRTETGPLAEKYQLKQLPTVSNAKRTEKNVIDSDGTLILSHGKLTGGSALTLEFASTHQRPCLHVDLEAIPAFQAATLIASWLEQNRIEVLNVAGPRASKDSKIYHLTKHIIESVYYLNLVAENMSGLKPMPYTPPHTIENAVKEMISELPLKDKVTIANMTVPELPALSKTVGNYIQNKYQLTSSNSRLMESCRATSDTPVITVKDAVMAIIKALHRELYTTHRLRVVK